MSVHGPDPAAWSLPARTKRAILFATLLALFLAALDQTIVATALPAIVAQFHGIDLVAWISIGYLVASTAMVPVYGRLSDSHGRRGVLIAGIIVFLLGSVLCGLAGSMMQLILFRVVQGVGAAAITSTAFSVPADLFAPAERSRYMGFFGACFGLSSLIGPWLGGLLTDHFTWRWVFYVNLPLGAVAMLLVVTRMPHLGGRGREPLDLPATALMIATVVPLLVGLSVDPRARVLGMAPQPWLFGAALVAGALYVVVERRSRAPVIPFELFRNPTFATVTTVSFLFNTAFLAAVLFLSLFMVNVLGTSAAGAGTAIVPLMVGVVTSGIATSFIVHHTHRYKAITVAGLALMTFGFWLISRMTPATTTSGVMWRMAVLGLGAGPAMPVLSLALQNAVPHAQVGTATAARQFFAQVGAAMGAALFGMLLGTGLTAGLERHLEPVLATLPTAARVRLDPTAFRHGASGREGPGGVEAELRAQMRDAVTRDAARRLVLAPDPAARAAVEAERAATLVRVDAGARALAAGVRQSFAEAITRVYFIAIFPMTAAVLVLLIWLREAPLRGRSSTPAVVE